MTERKEVARSVTTKVKDFVKKYFWYVVGAAVVFVVLAVAFGG